MNNFEITNISNYVKNLDINDYNKIMTAYEIIIQDFITYTFDTIFIQKKDFLLFIIKRGLETIKNVFIQLLMYTKNINLVFYHCKKAYYYYIEFIGQISDDTHSYLQLSSKDAVLFVVHKNILCSTKRIYWPIYPFCVLFFSYV